MTRRIKIEIISISYILIGFLSAIVDNVLMVAAIQGMYPLSLYPIDHFFWEFLAFATGTGGSILIINSAAGVAVMGMENITFTWFLKRISLLALIEYIAGALIYYPGIHLFLTNRISIAIKQKQPPVTNQGCFFIDHHLFFTFSVLNRINNQ